MAKADEIAIAPDEPYAVAGARIVRVRTGDRFEHDEGVLDKVDIEREHDMRVVTRRSSWSTTPQREYAAFLELWQDLERRGFRARLEYAVCERSGANGRATIERP